MESEVLSEEMEWEVRRVAAAFGIAKWDTLEVEDVLLVEGLGRQEMHVLAHINTSNNEWFFLEVTDLKCQDEGSALVRDRMDKPPPLWGYAYRINPNCADCMARGFYCLGVEEEDEEILHAANNYHPLSAHEKLELRLSMPREFWPQQWIEEENE